MTTIGRVSAKPAVVEAPSPSSPDGVREVRVSSPDRVLWPAAGMADGKPVTKLDVAHYLVAVADPMLRALGDRPVTLQRFPEGIEGEEFFSKNPPKGVPEWTRTVMCTYPSGRKHPQLVIDEVADAVWAAQMNTITFHPWPVRTADVDSPDELRIDLDPQPGRGFTDAVEAAVALREVMAEIGLTAWAKTSGNRGVHVYARVAPTHEFLDVRHGVIGIARELERRLPDLVTTSWWKEERGEQVFVDFNQACRDRTIASAYSPRPLPGAPVSTPVTWDELAVGRPQGAHDPHGARARRLRGRRVGRHRRRGRRRCCRNRLVGQGRQRARPRRAELPAGLPEDARRAAARAAEQAPHRTRPTGSTWRPRPSVTPTCARRGACRSSPPVSPMLAKPVKDFSAVKVDVLYEPKWDGFRSIIFRSGDHVEIGSAATRSR